MLWVWLVPPGAWHLPFIYITFVLEILGVIWNGGNVRIISTCHVTCVGDNLFITFKAQIILHSFNRGSTSQNVGLFIVAILGIPYLFTNIKRDLPLPSLFCVHQCCGRCIYPVRFRFIIFGFCLVLHKSTFVVFFLIRGILIIGYNCCS